MTTTSHTGIPYALERIGTLMRPEPGNPWEVEGVLNPAAARGSDGQLYLYPRLVAAGNVSRIGRARVVIVDGVPTGVEREGAALEADRGWEHGTAHGGVEDPRITWIPSLGAHVMTYVAFGPLGPRPALAVSSDGIQWRRLGPVQFAYDDALDTDLNLFPNKDVVFFPEIVADPEGRPAYAVLHRPMWELDFMRSEEEPPLPTGVTDTRPGIWISYVDAAAAQADITALTRPAGHLPVAGPEQSWESAKIGAGPAPIRIPEGWLVIYHGVEGEIVGGGFTPQKNVRYSAGFIVLDPEDPSRVIARTPAAALEPTLEEERNGTVGNVVFPTAVEEIEGTHYVFYGMADTKIGVARLVRTES